MPPGFPLPGGSDGGQEWERFLPSIAWSRRAGQQWGHLGRCPPGPLGQRCVPIRIWKLWFALYGQSLLSEGRSRSWGVAPTLISRLRADASVERVEPRTGVSGVLKSNDRHAVLVP
eukprot:6442287-Pyramimonas_sp.AAC.1